jgi:ubiquinone/menaquinone biosynthesis C-methylase UbiE
LNETGEARYYENPDIWREARYLEDEGELRRFEACARLIPQTSKTLLDVGAGNGAFMHYLESRSTHLTLLGLERSRMAISYALCESEIRYGVAENVPLEDGSFDLVSALEVLEHLPYAVYERALQEMERVARKHIIVSVPYEETRTRAQCPYCACVFNPYYHIRSFDDSVLSSLFQSFRMKDLVKIHAKEVLFKPQLVKIYQGLSKNGLTSAFHRNALCPQCGFYIAENNDASDARASGPKAFERLRNILPKRIKPYWAVALYERGD